MNQVDNENIGGQSHSIRVEKLPDGRYRASDTVLGDKVRPVVADRFDMAVSLLSTQLDLYDRGNK